VVVTGSPATVVAGDKATANVTNTYKRGSLEITKTVDWSGYTPDTGQTFEICITGPSYPTGNCKTADYDGEVLTWDNLIPGDYTVTETDPGTEWSVVVTGSPATVVAGGAAAQAEVTNTYRTGARIVGAKFANQCCSNDDWDNYEPGLPGWRIELWQGTSKLEEVLTDEAGYFAFEDVAAGSYTVKEEPVRPGWTYCTTGNLRTSYEVVVTALQAANGAAIGVDKDGRHLWFGNKPDHWPPKSATAMSPQGSLPAEGPVCD